eukprot:17520-Heterococcus_DN1.PRE.1
MTCSKPCSNHANSRNTHTVSPSYSQQSCDKVASFDIVILIESASFAVVAAVDWLLSRHETYEISVHTAGKTVVWSSAPGPKELQWPHRRQGYALADVGRSATRRGNTERVNARLVKAPKLMTAINSSNAT